MTPRWLLLAHQLPTRSSRARVRTWRRLQQVGAVAARNAVYVLPNTDQGREDFEWIRSDIISMGGEATVLTADAIDANGDEEVAALFSPAGAGQPRRAGRESPKKLAPADYRKLRWVTRPRPGVDRMSSAWLIRRFIDPRATFAFVDKPGTRDVPFDMYEGAFSHQGGKCTFETLALRFGITDPVVARLARVVHDLDMKDARYGLPEAAAVGHLVEGLRQIHADDQLLLERGIEMFEAMARSIRATTKGGRTGRRAPRKRRS